MKFFNFIILMLMSTLVACNPVDTEIGSSFFGTLSISHSKSVLTVSNTQVATGSSIDLSLKLSDQNGNPFISDRLLVTFSTAGGTSVGSFSSVTNHGDGSYSASFTGLTPGTPTTIRAHVNGMEISNNFPSVEVTVGAFSLANSIVTPLNTSISSSSSVIITLTTKDNSNTRLTTGGLNVVFSNDGGTSTGSWSMVTDHHDGTYSSVFTGITAGTPTTVRVHINGALVISSSPSITVIPGMASKLSFLQSPSNTASGSTISPAVRVGVLDANNNLVTGHPANIELSISSNPSGGTLSGTLVRSASTGLAIFDNLNINFFGDDYKLVASSGTLTSSYSVPFNITPTSVHFSWPFDGATASEYVFDPAKLQFSDGMVKLYQSSQEDNASTELSQSALSLPLASQTGSGLTYGVLADGESYGLKLGNSGTCNGATSNCSELDSSWTPKWEHLRAYWKLNTVLNGTALEVLDSSGNAHHGTRTGTGVVSTSSSMLGRLAANFDGNGHHITIPNSSLLENLMENSFTLSGWFQPRQVPPGTGSANNYAYGLIGKSGMHGGIQYNGNKTFQLNIWVTGVGYLAVASTMTFEPGKFYHLAGVVQREAGKMTIYVDGVARGTTSFTPNATLYDYGINPFMIGRVGNGGGWDAYANGMIDEVAVWSTALTAQEVETIYKRQSAGIRSPIGGFFISRTMDAKSVQSWDELSWITALPFGKELPDAACSPGPTCFHTNSESSTDYSSLVGSNNSTSDNNLMSGIVGLWHLNENSWGDVAGEVKDFSGQAFHGRAKNGANTTAIAKFNRGAYFDAVNDYVDLGTTSTFNLLDNQEMSISFWYHPTVTNGKYVLTFMSNTVGWDGFRVNTNNTADMGIYVTIFRRGTEQYVSCTGKGFTWHHYTLVVDSDEKRLYLDGQLCTSFGTSMPNLLMASTNITHKYLGAYLWAGSPGLNAYLDEVAFWHRKLNDNEVKQLYQRGANRIKFQVRSCNDTNCDGENWKGPDGTATTFFSELNNNSAPYLLNGFVKKTSPSVPFSSFISPPDNNQFFQYRAIFESDTTVSSQMPELKSVKIGPDHFEPSSPSIYGKNGIVFSEMGSFTENLGSSCPGGVGYNISLDKVSWKFWNGTSWVTSNDTAIESNSAAVIGSNLSSFGSEVGRGTVYVKAYLKSSGSLKCELDSLQISGVR